MSLEKSLARKLSFSEGDELPLTTTCPPERLRVFVRMRNLSEGEDRGDITLTDSAVTMRTTKSTAQGRDSVEETSFSFDAVFGAESTQEEVYVGSLLPQVHSLLAGRDTLTFAYGTTNAGKTYTIQGLSLIHI